MLAMSFDVGKGLLGNLSCVWGYVKALASHPSGQDFSAAADTEHSTIEREENDGWINIHSVPDTSSSDGSVSESSDSEDEIEFHDASSGDGSSGLLSGEEDSDHSV
jgi:hypothetical protein